MILAFHFGKNMTFQKKQSHDWQETILVWKALSVNYDLRKQGGSIGAKDSGENMEDLFSVLR